MDDKDNKDNKGLSLKEKIKRTQVFRSIFRHGFEDTFHNRVLKVMSNVFMHLHPVKISFHGIKIRHTWCMGGIRFFLFVVLTVTGVLLMFYYHPDKANAYNDMKYLEYDVPFGILLRNMHRWAAHLMVITVWLHMFRVVMTGSYRAPRGIQLGCRGGAAGADAFVELHGLLAAG